MTTIEALAKPYIVKLEAYSSARSEYSSNDGIWLDANENNMGNALYSKDYNRYPDPMQFKLKSAIVGKMKGIVSENIFIGNGSDEALDLLFRVFVEPGKDAIAITSPTYGMYKVLADSHNAECIDVPLKDGFQCDVEKLKKLPANCKLLFLCSPNNPTGNDLNPEDIEGILNSFKGIVILDEAYIHFSNNPSWSTRLKEYPNLMVTQTFSKAHGLAGLRVGMAFANPEIISLMNKVKLPYNMNAEVLRLVEQYLAVPEDGTVVQKIISERKKVAAELETIEGITVIFPSSANFILFTCQHSSALYNYLKSEQVIIRNREKDYPNALRVSIGEVSENQKFLELTKAFYSK